MKEAKRIEVIARGLVRSGSKVLVCQPQDGTYCYLPGGHVEPGEAAQWALAREFKEECGLAVEVHELIAVTEERFRQGGRARHEINLVFHVELPVNAEVDSLEEEITFRWIDLAQVEACGLLPRSAARLAMFHVKHDPLSWSSSSSVLGDD